MQWLAVDQALLPWKGTVSLLLGDGTLQIIHSTLLAIDITFSNTGVV